MHMVMKAQILKNLMMPHHIIKQELTLKPSDN